MLRALAFEAMGQQQHQTAQPLPLALRTGQIKIDHGLGIVDKIPELGFPDDKLPGLNQ